MASRDSVPERIVLHEVTVRPVRDSQERHVRGARSSGSCRGTSLGADQAGPDELARLVRGHWEVENRLHSVRDFSYDEDRCRAAARHLARNLAALSNAAISIVRVLGRFRHIPPAHRHYAARPQDALDAVLST